MPPTLSFIHSPPNIQGSYQALHGDAEMDKHSSCPWRTYNDGGGGGMKQAQKYLRYQAGRQAGGRTNMSFFF